MPPMTITSYNRQNSGYSGCCMCVCFFFFFDVSLGVTGAGRAQRSMCESYCPSGRYQTPFALNVNHIYSLPAVVCMPRIVIYEKKNARRKKENDGSTQHPLLTNKAVDGEHGKQCFGGVDEFGRQNTHTKKIMRVQRSQSPVGWRSRSRSFLLFSPFRGDTKNKKWITLGYTHIMLHGWTRNEQPRSSVTSVQGKEKHKGKKNVNKVCGETLSTSDNGLIGKDSISLHQKQSYLPNAQEGLYSC